MIALFLLLACGEKDVHDTAEPTTPPTLSFLEPSADATVPAGDVSVSLLVEDFELVEPAATARVRPGFDPTLWLPVSAAHAHGDEAARGYVVLTLDGGDPIEVSSTQATLSAVAAGEHVLVGELMHEDGEALDPAVTATVTFTAE